jgi:hypothetical protein
MTIPSWESNTGFVWRLFAATPAVVRVRTDHYAESIWCRRETELTDYLLDQSDFLEGRIVADASVAELQRSVQQLVEPRTLVKPERPLTSLAATTGFPPVTMALKVPDQPLFILNLLAAVCSLRLLQALIGDVPTVNAIADRLSQRERLDVPAPTNAPDGWKMHSEVFEFLAQYVRSAGAPVHLASDYPEKQRRIDIEDIALRIPDLRAGGYRGLDLLAALEWNREIRRWFGERWGSHRAFVDCRGIGEDEWLESAVHGLQRGMIALRTETLLFVVQDGGQSVDTWAEIRERDAPILTQHVSGQLNWMVEGFAYPTWIAAYISLPDFVFHPEIERAAFDNLANEFAAYKGLHPPTRYEDVFAVNVSPDNPLSEALNFDRPKN